MTWPAKVLVTKIIRRVIRLPRRLAEILMADTS